MRTCVIWLAHVCAILLFTMRIRILTCSSADPSLHSAP